MLLSNNIIVGLLALNSQQWWDWKWEKEHQILRKAITEQESKCVSLINKREGERERERASQVHLYCFFYWNGDKSKLHFCKDFNKQKIIKKIKKYLTKLYKT